MHDDLRHDWIIPINTNVPHFLRIFHVSQHFLNLCFTWTVSCNKAYSKLTTKNYSNICQIFVEYGSNNIYLLTDGHLPNDLMIVPISLASTVLFCSWSNTSNASKTFFWTSGLRLSEEWEDDWDWRLDTIRLRIIFFRPCYILLLFSFLGNSEKLKTVKLYDV